MPISGIGYEGSIQLANVLRCVMCRRHPDALPIGRAKSSRRTSLGGALFQRPLSRRVQTIQLGPSFWDSSSLLSSAHVRFCLAFYISCNLGSWLHFFSFCFLNEMINAMYANDIWMPDIRSTGTSRPVIVAISIEVPLWTVATAYGYRHQFLLSTLIICLCPLR